MTGKSETEKADAGVRERAALRVRVNLDLPEDTLREINRRVIARGWGQGAVPSWFRWLSAELVDVLQKRKKAERSRAVLPFESVELALLVPAAALIPEITNGLRDCMKGYAAGGELVRAVVAALEAGRRQ